MLYYIPRTYYRWKFAPFDQHLPFSPSPSLRQPPFYSIFVWLFLDFTSMWEYTVSAFLWLISLSTMPSRSIYAAANGKIFFFFYGWIIFHYVYMHMCVCDYICFIHSPAVGQLSCFHDLAIVNNVAQAGEYKYLLETVFSFLLNIYPEANSLQPMLILEYITEQLCVSSITL